MQAKGREENQGNVFFVTGETGSGGSRLVGLNK